MSKKRNISIQIIRIIAMIFIILCHIFNYSINNKLYFLGSFFDVGVFIFFFISGYLFGDKKIGKITLWLKKRFQTVLMPYYIFLLFIIILNLILNIPFNFSIILGYFLNLQYFMGPMNGLGHLWFVSIIMLCYLCVILIDKYKNFLIKNSKLIIGIFLIITVIIGLYNKKFGMLGYYLLTFYLGYVLKNKKQIIKNIPTSLIIVTGSLSIRILGKAFLDNSLFYETTITSVTHFGITLGIFMLISKILINKEIKSEKLLKCINYLDSLSYYIFIVHYMFLVGPIVIIQITNSMILNFILYLFVIFLSAQLLKKITFCINKLCLKICVRS